MKLSNIKVLKGLYESIDAWESNTNLKFDDNGRVRLGRLPESSLYIRHCFDSKKIINRFLEDKGWEIEVPGSGEILYRLDCYSKRWAISENMIRYAKRGKKLQDMKLTKFYSLLLSYFDCIKNEFDDFGQQYICSVLKRHINMVDEYLNKKVNGDYLWLTVNPMDILTTSNTNSSALTGFTSCWSVNITKLENGDYNIDGSGAYSDIRGLLAIGRIPNRGILYVPNGRKKGNFLGYKSRISCWLSDKNTIYTELEYPTKSDIPSNYRNILYDNGISVEHIPEVFPIQYEYENSQLYDYEGDIYLDHVGLVGDMIAGLPNARSNLDTDSTIKWAYGGEICEHCGDRYLEDDIVWIDNVGYVCNDCFDRHYYYCHDCGDADGAMDGYYIYDLEIDVCNNCLDNYFTCENCMNLFSEINPVTIDGDERYLCNDCYDDQIESDCNL